MQLSHQGLQRFQTRAPVVARPQRRAFVVVRAVAQVDSFTLKDGREVEVYKSKEDASKAICDKFVAAYNDEVAAKGNVSIAIPSGSVVQALGTLAGNKAIDFKKVHVFFCNERQGGKTFEGDKKDFITPCGVPLSNCYAIEDWSNPTASAAAYEALMMQAPQTVLRKTAAGAPSFDLILLGTGDDGHCASINPNTAEVKAKSGYVLPIPASEQPGGMTISIFLINAAKRVVVSAAEPKRAEMVKRALTGVFPEFDCPAGLVRSTEGSTTWVCDVDSIAAYKTAVAGGPLEYLGEAAKALAAKNFPNPAKEAEWMNKEPLGYKGTPSRSKKDGGFHAKK